MLSTAAAFIYRFSRTLLRGGIDSVSMFMRPLVMAALFAIFASAASPGGDTRTFMIISLMIFNVFSNTIVGAAYESRTDASGGRLGLLVGSPGGLSAYLVLQGVSQLAISIAQSALVGVAFAGTLAQADVQSAGWFAALALFVIISVLLAVLAAWGATIRGTFVSTSFAVGLVLALGGSFYPVDALPGWAQAIALVNPMTYVVDQVRAPLIGAATLPVGRASAALLGCSFALLVALVVIVLRRRVDLSSIGAEG